MEGKEKLILPILSDHLSLVQDNKTWQLEHVSLLYCGDFEELGLLLYSKRRSMETTREKES